MGGLLFCILSGTWYHQFFFYNLAVLADVQSYGIGVLICIFLIMNNIRHFSFAYLQGARSNLSPNF
jgi:hypothetical protein